MQLHAIADPEIPRKNIRATFRPNRYSYRSSFSQIQRTRWPAHRRKITRDQKKGEQRTKGSVSKVQGRKKHLCQRPYGVKGFTRVLPHRRPFQGAFEKCPIPTLILEGKWDLTWNTDKPQILSKNHPGSEIVIFENSGHGPYENEPEKFFKVLKDFLQNLPQISGSDLATWKNYLVEWKKKKKESKVPLLRSVGWGRKSNDRIAEAYSREWLKILDNLRDLLKTGFALYDKKKYEEALVVFKTMHSLAQKQQDKGYAAVALLWQGHMLDLLGRREEAISFYKKVVDLNINCIQHHANFRMKYAPSAYAAERIKQPFKRIENFYKE